MSDSKSKAAAPQAPAETFSRFDTSREAHDARHFARHGVHLPPVSKEDVAAPAPDSKRRKRAPSKVAAPAAAADPAQTAASSAAADGEPAAATAQAVEDAEATPAKRTRALKPRRPGAKALDAAAAAPATEKAAKPAVKASKAHRSRASH
jgi:hypothetical protein